MASPALCSLVILDPVQTSVACRSPLGQRPLWGKHRFAHLAAVADTVSYYSNSLYLIKSVGFTFVLRFTKQIHGLLLKPSYCFQECAASIVAILALLVACSGFEAWSWERFSWKYCSKWQAWHRQRTTTSLHHVVHDHQILQRAN